MADWSQPPQEIVETIAARLATHADLIRFRAVCRWWRSATASSHPKFPDCIPFIFHPKPPPSSHGRRLFCPIEGRCYRLPLAPRFDRPQGWRCFGSSNGWLLIANPHAEVRLLNPFTGARLRLPPLSAIPCIEFTLDPELWHRDTFCVTDKLAADNGTERRDFFVHRMALSLPSMTTMIIYGESRELACAKPGGGSWAGFPTRFADFDDVIYSEAREQFCAVSRDGRTIALDIDTCTFDEIGPSIHCHDLLSLGTRKYLVDVPSEGLLKIVRFVVSNRTVDFKIYKLIVEEEEGSSAAEWAVVDRFDGWAIFVGNGSSVAKRCSETQGCVDNFVYFTEDSGVSDGVLRDNGVFDVRTGEFWAVDIGHLERGKGGSLPLWLERRCLN